MEIRFRSILLAVVLGSSLLSTQLRAQSEDDESGLLIEPQIERTDFDESLIDSFDLEFAMYVGYLAVEDFDTNLVTGARIGYHISEDFFVQASIGRSEVGETSFEILSGSAPLLSDERARSRILSCRSRFQPVSGRGISHRLDHL